MSGFFKNHRSLPYSNIVIVSVTILTFLLITYLYPVFMGYGDLDYQRIVRGDQYWRIVSALFLHNGLNHLLNNMFLLVFLGAMIEKEVGHVVYPVVYLASGIGGNVLSLFVKGLTQDPPPSVGASGAIYGLIGLLLALLLFSKRKIEDVTPLRVILVIAFSVYSGYTSPQIDNAGHVGGLLTGFLAGICVSLVYRRKEQFNA